VLHPCRGRQLRRRTLEAEDIAGLRRGADNFRGACTMFAHRFIPAAATLIPKFSSPVRRRPTGTLFREQGTSGPAGRADARTTGSFCAGKRAQRCSPRNQIRWAQACSFVAASLTPHPDLGHPSLGRCLKKTENGYPRVAAFRNSNHPRREDPVDAQSELRHPPLPPTRYGLVGEKKLLNLHSRNEQR